MLGERGGREGGGESERECVSVCVCVCVRERERERERERDRERETERQRERDENQGRVKRDANLSGEGGWIVARDVCHGSCQMARAQLVPEAPWSGRTPSTVVLHLCQVIEHLHMVCNDVCVCLETGRVVTPARR